MPREQPSLDSWHLDKRIPIALILAVLLQAASFAWWAAKIDARVETLERRAGDLEAQDRKTDDVMQATATALSAIQEAQKGARASLDRIERFIDQQSQRPH